MLAATKYYPASGQIIFKASSDARSTVERRDSSWAVILCYTLSNLHVFTE